MIRPGYMSVYEKIRNMIDCGQLLAGDALKSEKELAKEHKVSRTTLRRSLSLLETEKYIVRRAGIGSFVLKIVPPKKAGLIIVLKSASHYADAKSFESLIEEQGFNRLLSGISETCTEFSFLNTVCSCKSAEELDIYLDRIKNQAEFSGAILANTIDYDQRINMMKLLDSKGLKYCSIDPLSIPTSPYSLKTCETPGIHQGLEYLWENGHRRLAFVGKPKHDSGPNQGQNTSRYAAYLEFVTAKNIFNESLILEEDKGIFKNTYNIVSNALKNGLQATALFCQNDGRAIAAMEACRDLGMNVPDDISIIGFDNIGETQIASIPISTVDINNNERGRLAVNYIAGKIPEDEMPLVLDSTFIKRESVGPAKA